MRSFCLFFLCLVILTVSTANAQTPTTPMFSVISNLGGNIGSQPVNVSLVKDSLGNLWGTTSSGGTQSLGTIFSATTAGVVTPIYNFQMATGFAPSFGVVLGTDGNFYGATVDGGTGSLGVLYQVTPSGTYTPIHFFNGSDGQNPNSLILGQDGNFYGTTALGGTDHLGGTAFKITASGTLTTLYNFSSAQSSNPGGIVQASDGSFYGYTVYGGGSSTCASGCGTVFHLTSSGTLTTIHSFSGNDGSSPSGLTIGTDGNFYGVSGSGGDLTKCHKIGCGTIFKMNAAGNFKTLHVFEANDGAIPFGPLTQGPDGNFYGVTAIGNAPNTWGEVFGITSKGTFKILHHFTNTDGNEPGGALLLHTDGKFYGTTLLGGSNGSGVIYSLDLGFAGR